MKKQKTSNLYQIVLFLYFQILVVLFESVFLFNLALIRYGISIFIFYKIILEVKNNKNKFLLNKNLMFYFMIWIVIMVFRGIPDLFDSYQNYITLKRFLSEELLIYTFPLLMFINIEIEQLQKILKLNIVFGIFYLLISIIFFSYFTQYTSFENLEFTLNAEALMVFFPSSLILLLLTNNYHSKRVNAINLLIILFATFIAIILARRNKVLYFGTALLFAGFLVNFGNTLLLKKNRFLNFSITFFMIIFSLVFAGLNFSKFTFFLERTETGIESRVDVIDDFFYDFNRTPQDWIIGRGIHGTFISKGLSLSDIDDSRDLIENGILQLILKGGVIYISFVACIIFISFYNGFIRSKNILSKSMALILILYLVDLLGYGLSTSTFKYMVIFIAISVCNSPEIIKLSDSEILKKIRLT